MGAAAEVPGDEGVDWKRCGNCRRAIPTAQFDRHELMCARHNWYCELCECTVERRQQVVSSCFPCRLFLTQKAIFAGVTHPREAQQRVLRMRR